MTQDFNHLLNAVETISEKAKRVDSVETTQNSKDFLDSEEVNAEESARVKPIATAATNSEDFPDTAGTNTEKSISVDELRTANEELHTAQSKSEAYWFKNVQNMNAEQPRIPETLKSPPLPSVARRTAS
ncbi:unnamed protein product, partial [Gongylonema pulchrum]|uniref:Peroxin-14 n=1 Tax=Gongylonema pulchrum TaxID=637853 RepID=A0A183EWP9_9BILA